jgi:hypothetical protein
MPRKISTSIAAIETDAPEFFSARKIRPVPTAPEQGYGLTHGSSASAMQFVRSVSISLAPINFQNRQRRSNALLSIASIKEAISIVAKLQKVSETA